MTSSTRQVLDPKRQSEVVGRAFDFTSRTQPGDVLSAPVVTASVWSGIDAAPGGLLTGSNSISGFVVTVGTQAGVVGVIYLLKVSVTASLSGTLVLEGLYAVLPEGM